VLRIRINFNADGDQAFYLNADSDLDPDHQGSQTNADREQDPAQSMLNMVMDPEMFKWGYYTVLRNRNYFLQFWFRVRLCM